jgi:Glycosyltransferase family 87
MASSPKSKLAVLIQSPVAAAVAVTAAIVRLFWIVYIDRPPNVQLDFSCYYVWGVAMRHHLNPYRLDLTPLAHNLGVIIGPERRATYAPTFILLFEPLSRLAPWTAYWIWSGVSVALLIVSIWLIVGTRRGLPTSTALIIASLALLYRPVQVHFEFLQIQILILFLLIMMWRALRAGEDYVAALYLAFAGLLKGYPLFMLLYLVCVRKWRVIAYTLVALVAGFGLTFALIGSRALWFFEVVTSRIIPSRGYLMLPKIGLAGAVLRTFARVSPHPGAAVVFAQWGIAAVLELSLLGLTIYAILRSRDDDSRGEYAFGLCLAAMVLLMPNAWPHYMVLLLLPLCQLAVAGSLGHAPPTALWLAVIAYVLVEAGHSAAYVLQNTNAALASWLIEGMFISALLSYAGIYILTVNRERLAQMPTESRAYRTGAAS